MRDRRSEKTLAEVPEGAKQAGDIRTRWSWVEPSVWTDRMLTALEKGVKGGQWFSLIDKVYSQRNLKGAFEQVRRNRGSAGIDHQTIAMFSDRLEQNLERLAEALRDGEYRPQEIKRVWIPKPGKTKQMRPLGIPTVRDRVAQTALRNVLEPIFEKDFAEHSYGFRPKRGCKDALRRVDWLLKQGYTWVLDADLKSYFDTIAHDKLMQKVEKKVSDSRVLDLIRQYLTQGVMETAKRWTPERGTPQGAVISPLLSNIHLDPFDHRMAKRGFEMVRYADDFVVLCRTEEEATRALGLIQEWADAEELELHPEKTRIVNAAERGGFDFLGYHFERGYRWPGDKSLKKLKDAVRKKTRRNNGHSLNEIIESLNRTTRGWFEYFKHGHRTTFPPVDAWIRMRLRSILRRRLHMKGRGRGRDHQRWPNAFFAEHGLFSLVAAHADACQSCYR